MRIFLINWNNANKDFVDAALELEKRGNEIVYWIGLNKQNFETNRQEFSKAVFHYYKDANLAIPPAEFEKNNFEPPGEDFIKQFYETESTVLSMFRRFQRWKMSIMEMKHFYYKYLQYWHGVIQELKPDVIIFVLWPHTGYDFVLYSLAKFFNIKTLMFEDTRIADRLLLINDYTIGSLFLKEAMRHNRNAKFKSEDLSSDIQKAYRQQTMQGVIDTPLNIKTFIKKYSGKNLLFIKLRMILKAILDFSILKKTFIYLLNKFKSNLKKEYAKLQIAPDFNKKFIYMALQRQPECSTCPRGGIFVDQILAIKILSASVPEDWLIYVKEHPIQWLFEGPRFSSYRFEGYYKTIAKLKNVRLMPMNTNVSELVKRSQAVSTMTGTTGWEALLRLKPVITFGYPWYRDCPGVFKANNVKSCKEAIENIENNFTINEQDIINYLYSLDKVSFHGYFDSINKPDVSDGCEYGKSIFNALITEIEGKAQGDNV